MNIGIVGGGYVGQGLKRFFLGQGFQPVVYDVNAEVSDVESIFSLNAFDLDFAYICVPTPMKENGECNISIVADCVQKIKAKTVVIKSTVPPGTTDRLGSLYNKSILFTPEYFGETKNHPLNDFATRNFHVIGGRPEVRVRLVELYRDIYQANVKFHLCTSKEAEIIKYMENCFLAMKVTFVEEFQRICWAHGVDYWNVREGWLMDPRVNPSHTFPGKDGEPGFGGKCLPKDISAIIESTRSHNYNPEFLMAMVNFNTNMREACKKEQKG